MALKFNYGKSRNTANRLIDKFGAPGAILRYPDYDPDPCLVAAISYENRQIDGTRIRQTDRYMIVAATKPDGSLLSSPVAEQDRIRAIINADTGETQDYEIIKCDPLSPAGQIVMYEIQARA